MNGHGTARSFDIFGKYNITSAASNYGMKPPVVKIDYRARHAHLISSCSYDHNCRIQDGVDQAINGSFMPVVKID
jgi:hypothetical protein